ncbi:DNA-processing protein DprA [Ectobacillus funiculus]
MKVKRERLLHLHHSLADNWRAMECLLRWDPDLKQLYNLSPHDFFPRCSLFPPNELLSFILPFIPLRFPLFLDGLQRHDICYTTIFDDTYPSLLKEIADPPFVLYGKGDLFFLCSMRKKLAVVGTRRPSHYGILSVQSILSELLKEDWVIVSGMAYGIDMAAHISAAHQNRYTIAVLGGGFRYIYPKDNYTVLQKHSQYVFICNRISAALSAAKSGTSQGEIVL